MFRRMGPFAIRDLRLATRVGRFQATNAELVWRLATHAIVGASLAITNEQLPPTAIDETVVCLLCTTGIGARRLWRSRSARGPRLIPNPSTLRLARASRARVEGRPPAAPDALDPACVRPPTELAGGYRVAATSGTW